MQEISAESLSSSLDPARPMKFESKQQCENLTSSMEEEGLQTSSGCETICSTRFN